MFSGMVMLRVVCFSFVLVILSSSVLLLVFMRFGSFGVECSDELVLGMMVFGVGD